MTRPTCALPSGDHPIRPLGRQAGALLLLLACSALAPAAAQAAKGARLVGELSLRAMILRAEDERNAKDPILPEALQSSNPAMRARAARALGRIGDAEGLPLLAAALDDPQDSVRYEAVFALGETEQVAALGSLSHALLSRDRELRLRAAEALSKLRYGDDATKRGIGGLIVRRFLAPPSESEEGLIRILNVAWRLGSDSPGLTEALRALSRHDSPRVAEAAVYAAWRGRDAALSDVLFEACAEGRSVVAKTHGARGLGALAKVHAEKGGSTEEWRALLVRHATNLDYGDRLKGESIRIAALRSLAAFDPPEELDAIRVLNLNLNSPRHHVQSVALTLAERWKIPASLPLLQRLTTTDLERPDVVASALPALVVLLDQSELASLKRLSAHPDWRVRAALAGALDSEKVSGSPVGRDLQDLLLNDQDARVVAPALGALIASGRRDADIICLAHLGAQDVVVRAVAASELPNLKAEPGREARQETEFAAALRRCFREARNELPADTRISALEALAALLGPRAAPDLRLGLQHPDYTVRLAARRLARQQQLTELAEAPIGPVGNQRSLYFYEEAARDEAAGRVQVLHLMTNRGEIQVELLAAAAPLTVQHITQLARMGYFDGITFHRVVADFVAQGGDPRGDGWGGPGTTIRCEINDLRYSRGMMGMALSGKDTGGSQFFFTHSPQPHLNGGYTIFGRVRPNSMAVVDALRRYDRINVAAVEAGEDWPGIDSW